MTPWLADSARGLTTTGKELTFKRDGGSETGNTWKCGVNTPADANARRVASLFRLISAAHGGLPGSPNAAAMCAASTVGRSPTASTPDTSCPRHDATTAATDDDWSWNLTG